MAGLKIIKSTRLEDLAKDLIAQIKANENPFDTYTIIVPNMMVEQWFKAFWMKNTTDALMNVKFDRMRPFIYNVFDIKEEDNIFNEDNLKTFIITLLLKYENNIDAKYPDIFKYIHTTSGNNSINLYEIAREMASLFIKYDISKTVLAEEDWENKLRKELINEYNYVFLGDKINTMIDHSQKIISGENIFYFGFQMFENLYIDIIKYLAKDNNVFVYKQYTEKPEDDVFNADEIFKETQPKKVSYDIPELEQGVLCEAATLEREIEFVHSEICHLIDEAEESGKFFRFGDVIVLAKDISKYSPYIKKVFTECDSNYPNIPFVIYEPTETDSLVASALKILYKYLTSGYLTKLDFYDLMSNKMVQGVRGLSDEMLDVIMHALDNMNVYRNNEREDDWLYGLKRLLLSTMLGSDSSLDNKVELSFEEKTKTYVPFDNMELTNGIITKFADAIKDLESLFLNLKKNKYDKSDLVILKDGN